MKRRLERIGWALAGAGLALGVALTYGVATGQQGPGPGPGGPGGRGMVAGTIAQKDLQNNAVLVNMQGEQRWVQLPQGVRIMKQVDVKVADLKEKDRVVINGTPTAVDATNVQVTDAQAQPGGGAAAGPGGGPGQFPVRSAAFAMITGTLAGVEAGENNTKLTVLTGENNDTKVVVTVNDKTRVVRQTQLEVKDVAEGDQFTAWGQPDERGVVQAWFAAVGDVRNMFGGPGMFGGAGMFGGPGMFGGARRGNRSGGGAGGQR